MALLPVWGWGPHLGPGHLDPSAPRARPRCSPRGSAIPIHWGTLAVAGRGVAPAQRGDPARAFAAQVAATAPSVSVVVLEPGSSLELGAPEPSAPSAPS